MPTVCVSYWHPIGVGTFSTMPLHCGNADGLRLGDRYVQDSGSIHVEVQIFSRVRGE